jgi:hypothetical protein
MKITNASADLIGTAEIEITDKGVSIGQRPGVAVGTVVMVLFVIAGIYVPGPWYVYWIAGFVLSIVAALKTPDGRKVYTPAQIESVTVLGMDRVGTKGAAGSLGGAAVGGLLFGGFGAVVGAVAGGNKVEEFKNICIVFTDGEWVVVTSEKGFVSETGYQALIKMAGANNQCPVERSVTTIEIVAQPQLSSKIKSQPKARVKKIVPETSNVIDVSKI